MVERLASNEKALSRYLNKCSNKINHSGHISNLIYGCTTVKKNLKNKFYELYYGASFFVFDF